MNFKKGDMFSLVEDEPIFVTTSAFLTKEGELLMNRGAAASCVESNEEIALRFGELTKKHGRLRRNTLGNKFFRYGTLYLPEEKLGVFQVKYHFKDDVDLDLIRYSAAMLAGISRAIGAVHMNFPGCSYAKGERQQVMEALDEVLDREDVYIWRLEAIDRSTGPEFVRREDDAEQEGPTLAEFD